MLNRGRTILFGSLSLLSLAACGSSNGPIQPSEDSSVPALTDKGAMLALACTGCHSNQSDAIASLEGYTEATLIARLEQYKSETDGTTVMHRLARGYSDNEIALVSAALTTEAAP